MIGKGIKYQYFAEYPFTKYQDFQDQMNGGKIGKRAKLNVHGFEWVDGCVKCVLCNIRFRQTRLTHTHVEHLKHQKN